jgi:hypothetical protein
MSFIKLLNFPDGLDEFLIDSYDLDKPTKMFNSSACHRTFETQKLQPYTMKLCPENPCFHNSTFIDPTLYHNPFHLPSIKVVQLPP